MGRWFNHRAAFHHALWPTGSTGLQLHFNWRPRLRSHLPAAEISGSRQWTIDANARQALPNLPDTRRLPSK